MGLSDLPFPFSHSIKKLEWEVGRTALLTIIGETEFTWSCSEQGLSIRSITTWMVSSYLHLCGYQAREVIPKNQGRHFTLIPPLARRYIFCDTFRYPGLSPGIPPLSQGTLSCGVRTFLPVTFDERNGTIAQGAVFSVI